MPRKTEEIRGHLVGYIEELPKGPKLLMWTEELKVLVGDPKGRIALPEVDAWGYRTRTRGQVARLEDQRVTNLRFWNPLDQRTSRFCRWIHGRQLTVKQAQARLRRYKRMKTRIEDKGSGEPDWLWLPDPNSGSVAEWERLWRRGRIGLPPFHFFCRTGVLR